MYHRKRYPVEKSRSYQCVGRLLPHRIGQIFHELGFKTWVNPKQGNDIDLKVFLGNKLTIAIEALNWSVGSVLSEKRKNNIIKNLTKYNCKRLLIYTVLNKNAPEDLEDFTRNRISLIKIGYQLLPKEFFKFFFEKRQIDFRKIDSSETKEDIKKKLKTPTLDPHIDALLFAADRIWHIEKIIKPNLEKGYIVISDRYFESSIAYQGAQGVDIKWIQLINKNIISPDITIILDISPEKSLERIKNREIKEKFESVDFLKKVREIYFIIDAEKEIKNIKEKIKNIILRYIRENYSSE